MSNLPKGFKPVKQDTDYKELFNSTFLNNGDIKNKDTIVKILSVGQMMVQAQDGRQLMTAIVLDGYEKPMKACNEILDNIAKVAGSRLPSQWGGLYITAYVQYGLRCFGGVHDVVRVRPVAPRVAEEIPWVNAETLKFISDNFEKAGGAIPKYLKDNNLKGFNELRQDKAETLSKFISGKLEELKGDGNV
jgi:hypothetical protein